MDELREYQQRRLDLADMLRAVMHVARHCGAYLPMGALPMTSVITGSSNLRGHDTGSACG